MKIHFDDNIKVGGKANNKFLLEHDRQKIYIFSQKNESMKKKP